MRNTRTSKWMSLALLLAGFSVSALSWAQDTPGEKNKSLYLRGNEEWGQYCANCHYAIPPSDRAPHEWDTIMQHMRVEANMPADSAQALLEYLRAR
ncbi:MAG: hypothetical protein HYZ50_03150 [Deltaproteobacteria bacterium]|nr:hypothetical protein [Deltaproteobacteria bacterium]